MAPDAAQLGLAGGEVSTEAGTTLLVGPIAFDLTGGAATVDTEVTTQPTVLSLAGGAVSLASDIVVDLAELELELAGGAVLTGEETVLDVAPAALAVRCPLSLP